MHRFWRLFLAIAILLTSLFIPFTTVSAEDCRFVLGFKSLHDAIPGIVGDCKVNEHYNPQNGDALQETTNGLLVWRKVDNFTAFTDGYRTWVNGPYGIQQRLNTERFAWEADAARATKVGAASGGLVVATVVQVVDGDTIKVAIAGRTYTVRYIGVDSPETVDPRRPVQAYGKEASAKNRELIGGKRVLLEKDVSETDRYGRLLRYVYVDNLMVNAELVRLGYAQVSTYPPDVKHQQQFLDLQREAREAGRGLWGSVSTPVPRVTVTPMPTPTPAPKSHPAGATAICRDGTYSYSQNRRGTCSWHGGVAVWLR